VLRSFATPILITALIGCGGSAHPVRPLPGPRLADDSTNPCPTQVEGAQVRSEIIDGGIALVFYATNSDQIGAVRSRVHALAAANPTGDAKVNVAVLDTSDGARLELRPDDQDPDRLSDLRDRVAELADTMNGGDCVTRVADRGTRDAP
jgi:hypothetical protein